MRNPVRRVTAVPKLKWYYFYSLIPLVVGMLWYVFSLKAVYSLQNKADNLHRKLDVIKDSIDHLTQQKDILQTQEDTIRSTIGLLRDFIESTKKTGDEYADNLLMRAQNSLVSVAIYGYQVDNSRFVRVSGYFHDKNYAILESRILPSRTSWLAANPEVLYYDDSMKAYAMSIANDLTRITGQQFQTVRGKGYNIIPGQEKYTFKIHFVK